MRVFDTKRHSWEMIRDFAKRDLAEVQYNLDSAPYWIEQDLKDEEARLLSILIQAETALTTWQYNGGKDGNHGEE